MRLSETVSGSGYTTDDLRKMAAEKQAFQDANKQLGNTYMQYNSQYYCPYCAPKCPCCGKPYSQPQYYPYYYNTRGGSIGSAFNAGDIRRTQHNQTGT